MPGVVGYWQLPADEKDLLDFLQGTGAILALPDNWVGTREGVVPQPIVPFIDQHDPDQFLFGLAKHVLQVRIEERTFEGVVYFGPAVMEPCLIAYRRGKLRSGQVVLSNLSAYWDYPSADASELIEKDQEFVRWAKKVMGWVRKFTPERIECNGYPYRATRRVRDAVCGGNLEVKLY
jgi:hypothetical protein